MTEVALNFRRYGDTGPAVLMLHGLFGSAKNWHSQATSLAGDFSVYAVDLRNHGASPHCDQIDYPSMAADVLALIDAQGIEQANILGHSMGGKVAMQIALQAAPRVQKLIVVDIAPKHYPGHHDGVLEAMQAVDFDAHRTRQDLDRALSGSIPDPSIRQFILTNLVRDADTGTFTWQLNLRAIVANYARLATAPQGQPFQRPALFIKGADSNYIQAADRETIEMLFPQARAKVIANAGHWPHAEKPRVFAKLVGDFLRGG
ncbi:MAG: alpha/beta fold hydrolase [Gammaproteobacteria bacterium]|nr:alpha/beta fold hydrolase [Gammaproteobacteria bacterium]